MTTTDGNLSITGIKGNLKADAWKICRDVPTERVLQIELTTPAPRTKLDSPALNLGLVIDRSGSMSDGKLEQAKLAVNQIIDMLREKDSVSVVVFDDEVNVVAEAESVNSLTRSELKLNVKHIRTGGSTNLGDGWLTGCQRVAHRQASSKINRTLLLSDGEANQGITNPAELGKHASEIFERGVSTSTFGIGLGFNEHLMEHIANRGGGNFYYINNDSRIPELLLQEFSDLASVTLKDARIQVEIPAGTKVELFGEWRSEKVGNLLNIYLSDLPGNRTVTLFLRLLISPAPSDFDMNVRMTGRGESDEALESLNVLHLTRASEDEVNRQPIDMSVLQAFASVAVGEIANEALKLERAGRRDEARQLMERTMHRYGPAMPASTRDRYTTMRDEIGLGLDESSRKMWNEDAYRLKRFRHEEQRPDPDKQDDEQK